MSNSTPKQLVITALGETSAAPPDPFGGTKLLVEYAGAYLGTLAIESADFADFVESLREGFSDIQIKAHKE